ncbi:hypothetical protein Z948_3603 [Sulfitobacter donghicola DSW-25 = KCTC 12864 = JCM 14565]|nr:hypothetical protein Z948_3603 [Sulfitobacter donghicola DSW-25 = KCTC 12864 = JCM 14565]
MFSFSHGAVLWLRKYLAVGLVKLELRQGRDGKPISNREPVVVGRSRCSGFGGLPS